MSRFLASPLLLLAVLVPGCHSAGTLAAPPTTRAPATDPEPTTAPLTPPVENTEACTAESSIPVVISVRPHSEERFGQLHPGDSVTIAARSKDGWLGFDPGVAQAANVGPFRLRWLEPSQVVTRGACAHLPETWTPAPGLCFEMPMTDVIVCEAPRTDANAVLTLHAGEFAEVVGREQNWVKVDLTNGNTGSRAIGFIHADDVNMNGPCEKLREP